MVVEVDMVTINMITPTIRLHIKRDLQVVMEVQVILMVQDMVLQVVPTVMVLGTTVVQEVITANQAVDTTTEEVIRQQEDMVSFFNKFSRNDQLISVCLFADSQPGYAGGSGGYGKQDYGKSRLRR